MFWDGRAPSLEGQAQGPVQNPIEMGKQSYKEIIERLRKIPGYREQFEKVFGTTVTLDGMAKAIATFERVAAISGNSKYDKYKDDTKALSDSEKRGMVLFGLRLSPDDDFKTDVVLQKAKCTLCHAGFNFTDEQFHNLGIGWEPGKGAAAGKFADLGRWAVEPYGARYDGSMGAFKTPTVRDVAKTAPYMHDGSLATLEQVVDHYDKGGNPNPALDPDMKKLNLTAQEKADVVAFMKALTGETKKLDELLPTLPPGPDGKTVDPRPALSRPEQEGGCGVPPVPVELSERARAIGRHGLPDPVLPRSGGHRVSCSRRATARSRGIPLRLRDRAALRWGRMQRRRSGRIGKPGCAIFIAPSSARERGLVRRPARVGSSFSKEDLHAASMVHHPRPGVLRRPLPGLLFPRLLPGSAVRVSRCRPLLLPAVSTRPAGVGSGPHPPLGDRGERGDAAAGEPHGGRALPVEGGLRAGPLCVGGTSLHRGPHGRGVLRDARVVEIVGDELDGVRTQCAGLCVRRTRSCSSPRTSSTWSGRRGCRSGFTRSIGGSGEAGDGR